MKRFIKGMNSLDAIVFIRLTLAESTRNTKLLCTAVLLTLVSKGHKPIETENF